MTHGQIRWFHNSLHQVRQLGVVLLRVYNESVNHSVRELDSRLATNSILQDLDEFVIAGFMWWQTGIHSINYGIKFLTKTCVLLGGNELQAPSPCRFTHLESWLIGNNSEYIINIQDLGIFGISGNSSSFSAFPACHKYWKYLKCWKWEDSTKFSGILPELPESYRKCRNYRKFPDPG